MGRSEVKQAVGFFPREVPLLALPPLALLATVHNSGRESWSHGIMEPKSLAGLPLSLIFSQVPGVPTGVAQAREDGSPNVPSLPHLAPQATGMRLHTHHHLSPSLGHAVTPLASPPALVSQPGG